MMQVGIQDIQLIKDQDKGRNTGYKVFYRTRIQVGIQDIKFIQDWIQVEVQDIQLIQDLDIGRNTGYTAYIRLGNRQEYRI